MFIAPDPVPKSYFSRFYPLSLQAVMGFRREVHEPKTIEFMWRLYNAWPNTEPRLEKTKAATHRIKTRNLTKHPLPPRKAFQTTVDYYEAVLPLMLAQKRFIRYIAPGTHFRGIHRVLKTIIPAKLF